MNSQTNSCYIGLDIGTTNIKAAALSPEGKLLACASEAMVYDSDNLAAQASPGADGLKVDIYSQPPPELEKHEKRNIARALMENVAFLFHERIKKLEDSGIPVTSMIMAGGPSQSPIWPGIVSDFVGMPVSVLPNGAYAGATGAAKIACRNDEESNK